jgi:RimJ/RimL family protein N-acetyltransferase
MLTPQNPFAPLKEPPPPRFETSRLILRAVTLSDTEAIHRVYASDPETCRYMSFKAGECKGTQEFVSGAVAYRNGETSAIRHFVWLLELKSSGEVIGSSGFGPVPRPAALAGGSILGRPFWGQGYASEAWCTLVDWVKSRPEIMRLEAEHHPDNPASGKVMEKAAMSFEGRLKRWMVYPNLSEAPQDSMMYAWTRG